MNESNGIGSVDGLEGEGVAHISPAVESVFREGLSLSLSRSFNISRRLSVFHVCVSVRTSTASPSSWTSYIDRFLTNLIGRYWLAHTHTSARPMIRSLCLTGFENPHMCVCQLSTGEPKTEKGGGANGRAVRTTYDTILLIFDSHSDYIAISCIPALLFTIDNWFICNSHLR